MYCLLLIIQRVNLQRILIPLEKECLNADMVPFVLPALLLIAEQCTDHEYTIHVLPVLIPLFKIANPIQVSHQCTENNPRYPMFL